MTELSKRQEREYRQWVRDHYEIESPIDTNWHPVMQDECHRINNEAQQTEVLDYIND